ncbi:putative Werner syndrome ATP-dependent helicase -like protein [Capsicum annuum]|nr:putative Werner syndrome ATP-dependent helicase -like protein [Capsicum annuum]
MHRRCVGYRRSWKNYIGEESEQRALKESLKECAKFQTVFWRCCDMGYSAQTANRRKKDSRTNCQQIKPEDVEMQVYTLDEDESWLLFAKNVGDIVNLEQIHPLVKEIARECDGLPLAITVVGSSMRGKTKVELWEDALKSLRMSEPHSKVVEDKVYSVIKWSFDSLESQDIELSSEQRRKHVNKKRGDIRSCFLYCSLYPAAIPTDDLIHCWWAEGILGEHDTYEEAYNRGITLIESLKDGDLCEDARPELPPVANLHNLEVLDCEYTELRCLPQGMENLTNLRLLNMPVPDLKSIRKGFFLKFPSIEMLNMPHSCLGATSFDEISSLHNLSYLFITVDSSSCFNRDYSWMTRLKGFHIHIGETLTYVPYNKSMRVINVHKCAIFSNGELSGMLQFASDLYLKECIGLICSVPKHLEEIIINQCHQLVDLFVQCSSSDQATLVNSEIPRVQKLKLYDLPELVMLVEPQSMWEHLEELTVIDCDGLRKLPRSLQTSKNIKIMKGGSEWWSQQEWDDENFKSNSEHCYKEWYY